MSSARPGNPVGAGNPAGPGNPAGSGSGARSLVLLLAVLLLAAFVWSRWSEPDVSVAGQASQDGRTVAASPASLRAASVDAVGSRESTARIEVPSAEAERSFDVFVQGRDLVYGTPLRVELLFGDRAKPTSLGLFVDHRGEASWPAGPAARWPWFVDFGFPTLGLGGVQLVRGATTASLTLPSTCLLEFAVVEVDGLPSSDALTAEVRAPDAPWPASRWRPIKFARGRASLLAEAGGQIVELRVSGASGRTASSRFAAATGVGHEQRIPCVVALAPVGGFATTCRGLPCNPADGSCELVARAFGEAASSEASLMVHTWPGATDRFVFFPPKRGRLGTCSWLLLAKVGADPVGWSWGVRDGAGVALMQSGHLVATGRVVDANGRGLRGYDVDLFVCLGRDLHEGKQRIATVLSGEHGFFQMFGPDANAVPLAIAVRQARASGVAAVRLPVARDLELRAAQ